MGKKPEEEIEEKLRELELAMNEEKQSSVPAALQKSSSLSQGSSSASTISTTMSKEQEASAMQADLHMLGGITALAVGLLILFQHLHVNFMPPPAWWGGGGSGTGMLVLLLIVGIGFFFYDYKNKIGWLMIVVSLAALVFTLFAGLNIFMGGMTLLTFIIIFIPFAFGGALVAKGLKMHSQIREQSGSK